MTYTRRNVVRLLATLTASAALCLGLVACGGSPEPQPETQAASTSAPAANRTSVRVASLKGPTSIGLVNLMADNESGSAANDYTFSISGSADEIVPKVVNGEVDIALVPANVASILYNKTSGGVSVIDINTLGVLSVVTGDSSIKSISDLAGHTVLMTGKGATPEYVMNFLLDQAGIADQVTLEFKSEATEVASALASDPNSIGVLPEPQTTSVCTKNTQLKPVINFTEAWKDSVDDDSQLVTGVTIVRTEFLTQHMDAVTAFIDEQRSSVDKVNSDPAAAAKLVVKYGIIDSEAVAAAAIPNCSLVCVTGSQMRQALYGYYNVLYSADKTSVGGQLPPDNYYWFG